jgi:ATP-dependent helicase HrpA
MISGRGAAPAWTVLSLEAGVGGALLNSAPVNFALLSDRLREAMPIDRERLGRLLAAAARPGLGGSEERLHRLAEQIEGSISRRRARLERLPRPRFDLDLPILARRQEIGQAIAQNQVVVICGETGSGKTTQLPKICLEVGRGVDGLIGHTQPRRIAARTVAARIAEELGSPLGRQVGYKVRFGDHTSPDTYIKVMTDGILLAESQAGGHNSHRREARLLQQYDTIIIDEAHERSLNIDFLLGYLRQLLPRRPDLKLIITSATIDPQRFAAHFALGGRPVPIIEVSGRSYPVEVRYRPLESDDPDDRELDQERAILAAVDELAAIDSGDILVFLSGEREIRQTAEALRKHHPTGTEILPLYARLSAAEQMRAFQVHHNRRIILATNVAETSLTVPGIRYVIDPGLARISRYSHRTKVQRLPIEPVSRASADQRKGRCGRLAEGVCIRLYSEQDYLSRPQFTDPEILRTNLASVILQMKVMLGPRPPRLSRIEDFPFIDPPDPRLIRDGYETLHELGALDRASSDGELTPLGRDMARFPIEPRLARMILQASREGCMAEVLVIAAALSIQDPRERPMTAQQAADQAHARFKDERSDFIALLNLWKFHQEGARHLSQNKLRKLCRDHFLSYTRLREWDDVHQQLKGLVSEMGLYHPQAEAKAVPATRAVAKRRPQPQRQPMQVRDVKEAPPAADPEPELDDSAIHRCVLAGLLANIGLRAPDSFEYNAPRAGKYSIFPGSGLFKKAPRWVVAAEVVQTQRLYARTVAKVEPEWIEPLAMHLVKRSHSDPHWSRDTGQVVAFEKVMLWGLEIVARRRVNYGPIEPAKAREIFIHHALVEGDTRLTAPFLEHNRRLLEQARSLEARTRRHDLVAETRELFAFYDARLPAEIHSIAALEKWRRQAEAANPRLLFMSQQDVLRPGAPEISRERYPDAIPAAGMRLNIQYHLDPGGPADGVTLVIPIEALTQLDDDRPEWLIPGLLKDKILALIRCLPKQYRKALDPAPVIAEQCAAEIPFAQGSLYDALAAKFYELRGVKIPRDAWQPRGIPDHLRLNISIVEGHGTSARELGHGRDLAELKKRFEQRSRGSFAKLARGGNAARFERDGITEWDFGTLPERIELGREGLKVAGYPALLEYPEGRSVSLRLLDTPEAAASASRAGIRRLFILRARDELEYHIRISPDLPQMTLHFAPLGKGESLKGDLRALIAQRAFLEGPAAQTAGQVRGSLPRNQVEFEQRFAAGMPRLGEVARQVTALVAQILAAHHAIALKLAPRHPPAWEPSIDDIRQQLAHLLTTPATGFMLNTPWEHLLHYPRYLAAIQVRLQRLQNAGLARDQRAMQELMPFWRGYLEVCARQDGAHALHDIQGLHARPSEALATYRWMLEEFRVSLFAQNLGTAHPISAKRLEEQWAKVNA